MTTVFFSASSPATGMNGLTGYSAALAILPAPVVLRVLKTKASGAQLATCSPADVSKPRTSCKPSGPIPKGFVQSMMILPARLPRPLTAACVADQGYADWIRVLAAKKGAWANIPPRCNRNDPICFSPHLYRARNSVERFFNKIKHCRRVATRYDNAANYLAFVQLASIRLWLRV